MTIKQVSILNSLVTFAAENVPGDLSKDEREVAQIVGKWARKGYIDLDAPLQKKYDELRERIHDISLELDRLSAK